jgi:hypothetical protein
MDFTKKVAFFNLKTVAVFGATALGILGLNGCIPQTPVAIVEPSVPVVQTFNYALEAETGHAKLYTTAKNNLASWKQANRPLYVCPVSGYTTLEANSKNCSQPFEKVS